MKTLKYLFALLLIIIPVQAQNIGQWKIYSDMKNISGLAISPDAIWAASDGGAFSLLFKDSSVTPINKANGLASQNVTSIAIDKNGRIWFGSAEGHITVYDPLNNKAVNILDIYKSNKGKKQINNIYISGDTAFVSTDFGLSLLSVKNLSFMDTFTKLGNFNTDSRVIASIKNNLVYVASENGVAIQKPGAINLSFPDSWQNFEMPGKIPAANIFRIAKHGNDILIATNNGVLRFSGTQFNRFLLEANTIRDLLSSGNSLFILSANVLYEYSNGTLNEIYRNELATFSSVRRAPDGTFYIGTTSGVLEYKNGKTKIIYPDGPYKNQFISTAVNSEGKVYVATGKDNRGVGFFEYDGEKWNHYSSPKYNFPSNDYWRVSSDGTSRVYFSNWGRGILLFDNGKFDVFNASNTDMMGIPQDTLFLAISDAKADSKGNIWIANHQPANLKYLSVYTANKKWYHYDFVNPSLDQFDWLDKMVIDQYDTKWFVVAFGRRGLYYFNEKGTFENRTDDLKGFIAGTNFSSDEILSLAVDLRGYLWIGTARGLNVIIDPSRPTTTLNRNIGRVISTQTITAIAVDPLNRKWIGTKQGVYVLSPDGYELLESYNTKNSPLPGDDIRSISVDTKNGYVYIGTDNGLAMLATSAIEPLESFDNLFVYPNPLIINGSSEVKVTIDGLIQGTSIKVLDISGNLVKDFDSPGGKIAFWDGKDSDGNFVPSGIYLIVAYDEEANNVKTTKVAVIRE